MAEPVYTLSESSIRELRDLRDQMRAVLQSAGGKFQDAPGRDEYTSETHLALVPAGGIPARSGTTPGKATCNVYRVIRGVLAPMGLSKLVWNPRTVAVAAGEYLPIWRDKAGIWWCERGGVSSGVPAVAPQSVSISGTQAVTLASGTLLVTSSASSDVVTVNIPDGTWPYDAAAATPVSIINSGSNGFYLADTAAMPLPGNQNLYIPPGGSATFVWDPTSSTYLPTGGSSLGGGLAGQVTGTTTAGYVSVYDQLQSTGIHGSFSVKNTGVTNGLKYQYELYDLSGNHGTSGEFTLGPSTLGSAIQIDGVSLSPAFAPYNRIVISVKDAVAASHTTFTVSTAIT